MAEMYFQLSVIYTDARRYFKQSEIVLYRQAADNNPLAQAENQQMAIS